MIKVIHLDDSGAEMASVEIDDFVIETVYGGIASLLKNAAATTGHTSSSSVLPKEARLRRQRILTRIHG